MPSESYKPFDVLHYRLRIVEQRPQVDPCNAND